MNHFLVALTYKCDRYLRYFIQIITNVSSCVYNYKKCIFHQCA